MNRLLLRSVLLILAGLTAGCSSFDARWKDAAAGKGHATRWDGEWRSGKKVYADGAYHHGRLRCVLVPQADKSLAAYFHANWLIFSGNFDLSLQPVPAVARRQKGREYSGSHDLPAAFGGTYHYHATITGDRFKAEYTCSIDQGIFLLQQAPPAKKP